MYYCGVCKSIGRNFGQAARFGLINESAILAILLDLATSRVNFSNIKKANCIAHPLKKSNFIIHNESIDYAAAINVMLMYYKLEDNWIDDKNVPSAAAKTAIKRGFKKARNQYPIVSDSIYLSINSLSKLEKANCSSPDEAAEPFAKMMMDVFKWKDNDVFTKDLIKLEILGNMGYNVGKWIYLIDAISDLENDKKSNSYNVFLNKYPDGIDYENVLFILNMTLATLSEEWEELKKIIDYENDFENIKYINNVGVIDNLIYIGMRHITDTKAGIKDESL